MLLQTIIKWLTYMYHSGWDCLRHNCSHQRFTLDGQFGNWRCDTCRFLFVWLVWRRQFCTAFHCVVSCTKRPRMARKPQYWQSVCQEQLLDRKDILDWKPLPHIITKSPLIFLARKHIPCYSFFLDCCLACWSSRLCRRFQFDCDAWNRRCSKQRWL